MNNKIISLLVSIALLNIGVTFAATPVSFYPSTQQEGFIGAAQGKPFDSPSDNVFEVILNESPAQGDVVWLSYELYGVQDHTAVSRSINNQLSVGGYLVKQQSGWTKQEERIAADWLTAGSNIIRFTLPENANYHYKIRNLGFKVQKGGAFADRTLVVNQPESQTYFNGLGYLKGFVTGEGIEKARIYVDGQQVYVLHGEFEALAKHKGDKGQWYATVKAVFPDGEVIEKQVVYNHEDRLNFQNAIAFHSGAFAANLFVPGKALELKLKGAAITVGADALTAKKAISITALRAIDIPAMDMGMVNVTKDHGGFRFLPHGTRFTEETQIALTYDVSKIPEGYSEKDIKTYYFDEVTRHWVALERDSILTESHTVLSKTTHFTDMINGIIKVPESPETAGFMPTSMSDIKAADPSAGVNLIEPPSANAMGSANMSYPIIVPAGRQGMQPQLAVGYNSEGGNGSLGLGWSLQIPSVTIDTRWGVPRYDVGKETETYTISGEQLYPTANRDAFTNRTSEKQFYPRVEGSFSRIIRHGNNPKNYWWEVTDKSGVSYFYGGRPGMGVESSSVLFDGSGNIAQWALVEVRDLSDNFVHYHYAKVEDTGIEGGTVPGYQLYIKEITYTGHGNSEGPYSVVFTRDRDLGEPRRPDVSINARYGFKQVTADLLRKVEVKYNGANIRSYTFNFIQGAFYKTLLSSITEYDAAGNEFNTHEFQYYDDARNGNTYQPFSFEESWDPQNDTVRGEFINPIQHFNDDASALSGSKSSNKSIGTAITIGFNDQNLASKSLSVGGKFGYSNSTSKGMLALIDINGDALPDKVFADGDSLYYRPNHSGPDGTTIFGESVDLVGINQFSRSVTHTLNLGLEAHPPKTFAGYDNMTSKTIESTYFSDINGDGLMDIITNGIVYYNHINDNGNPVFTASSADTPSEISEDGMIDEKVIEIDPAEKEMLIDQYPLHDVVKVWEAPFSGIVSITGDVTLQEGDPGNADDGVRVAIQHAGTELWSTTIGPKDYTPKMPLGVTNISVNKGDRLYFRVQSIENGANDVVSWSPVVYYEDRPQDLVNPNQQKVYSYPAEEGFIITADQTIQVPIDGVIKIEGVFKKPVTSDNIEVSVIHNGVIVWEKSYDWNQLVNDTIDMELNVQAGDAFNFRVTSNTNVKWEALSFTPIIYYTVSNDPDYPNITDNKNNPLLKFYPAVYYSLFSDHRLEGPESRWESTATTDIIVTPQLTIIEPAAGEVTFSVKSDTGLLAKKTLTVLDGVIQGNPFLNLSVSEGEAIYLEYHTKNINLADSITGAKAIIFGGELEYPVVLNVALYSLVNTNIFGLLYRHWGQFAYNGNKERATQPIHESDLELDDQISEPQDIEGLKDPKDLEGFYDPLTSNFIIMVPIPNEQHWRGYDDLTFVTANQISSSRMGTDDISGGGAIPGGVGVRAINRVTKSTTHSTAFGGGVGPFNGTSSNSNGTTRMETEFMDMNGDRYPDIVTESHIQYTLPSGSLEEEAKQLGIDMHKSKSSSEGFTLGGTYVFAKSNNTSNTVPRSSSVEHTKTALKSNSIQAHNAAKQASTSIGISGNYSEGEDETAHSWMDINGDGLPDKVYQNGKVSLNLGYSFAPQESWGYTQIKDGKSQDYGGGLGITFGNWSYAFGISLSRSENEAHTSLQDMNGDGLVDIVTKGTPLQVAFNTGSGFAPPVSWQGADAISEGASTGESINIAFTACIPLTAAKLCFNPSVTIGHGVSREWSRITDIDGDGYPDVLVSKKDNELSVKRSTIKRTNLLQSVSRPLGAEFTLDYTRIGNTYEMQSSQWALAKVIINDGFEGDGADIMASAFEYAGGLYNRHEREFYGFKIVKSHQLDTDNDDAVYRSTVREFINSDYYHKGLPERELMQDTNGNIYTESVNSYELKNVFTGDVLPEEYITEDAGLAFPALFETVQQFYEGQGAPQKSTSSQYGYDVVGNVVSYTNFGDESPDDDYSAKISYHSVPSPYIMGIPKSVKVTGDGKTYRLRKTNINNATGNITQIRKYLEGDVVAQYDMSYDLYGNLSEITRPQNASGERLSYHYTYDNEVHTYVTGITDSYGYSSSAVYDYRFGQLISTTDLNGQQIQYTIDDVGRINTVTGPLDLNAPYTIAFEYHPQADVPWALTRHYDPAHPDNDLETVTFIDGLRRGIQVKKDGAIYTSPQGNDYEAMIVSGRVIFDAFGRATGSYYPLTEAKGNEGVFNASFDGISPTTTMYDVLDRPLTVTLPDGAETKTEYGFGSDRNGDIQFSTLVTDANGIWKESFTNVRGLVTSVKQQYSQGSDIWTSYAYNPINELVTVLDDQSNVITSAYDWLGRRTKVTHPDAGPTTFTYDLAGNLTEKVTASLKNADNGIKYLYDHERLVEILYPQNPQNNVKYTYGASQAPHYRAGRVAVQEDASGSQEFFYNPLGAVIKNSRTIIIPNSEPLKYTTQWSYDTWNRVTEMIYPDGETLTYNYNLGGLLHDMSGMKDGTDYNYVAQLGYDKFEQRVYLRYGNQTETFYTYEPDRRRLQNLITETAEDRKIMNNVYTYDEVNNILQVKNNVDIPPSNLMGGSFNYQYTYDDLYRLTDAEGIHSGSNHQDRYTLEMAYNSVHSIISKNQVHESKSNNGQNWNLQNKTSYNWEYEYEGNQPHAPMHIGERTFTYDANGNQTGWEHDGNAQKREIVWDEENRIQSISDNGSMYRYTYDAAGERVLKSHGQQQQIFINGNQANNNGGLGNHTVYVNPYVVVRSGKFTKHFYIGSQRVTSKLGESNNGNNNNNNKDQEKFQYYFHPDHLGNSSYITDINGEVMQHVEYFPFGETFLEEHSNTDRTPYLFNGKELDEETGLYYYGARYYDPVTSVWQSVDPLAEKYPGWSPYNYTLDNPINLIDPDGREPAPCPDCPGPGYYSASVSSRYIGFGLRHPIASVRIGFGVTQGATNISTNATRFATRGEVLYGSKRSQRDEGSENGAFRHTLWQATITSEFDGSIAKQAGNAHEENPFADLKKRSFDNLAEADETVDLLNNIIGRNIGRKNKGQTMDNLANSVLDEFNNNGLFTATKDKKGNWNISRTKLSSDKYNQLKSIFEGLNKDGRTQGEQRAINAKAQKKIERLNRMPKW